MDPEWAHFLALTGLKWLHQLGLARFVINTPLITQPITLMGLTFPNAIGLSAGLDKNGDYIDALSHLGFGFLEIGTVTPKPQKGNPKPRLFRLTEHDCLINRMGFNNKGVDHLIKRLDKMQYRGILGINIGKNKETSIEKAADDYLFCFRALAKYASYITINISSPNTPSLRDLQHADHLDHLLHQLKEEQHKFHHAQQKYVPLVVKISPDLADEPLQALAAILLKHQIDGVIATNTTISRYGVEASNHANEAGGLSGKPLQKRSTYVLKQLNALLQNQIPIIASGGILDESSVQEKQNAGATLFQIYTGLIYQGPSIIPRLLRAIG